MQHLSKTDIQHLISGMDSSVETQNHLADCSECQIRTDLASADSWWWNDGRKLLASAVKSSEQIGVPTLKENGGYDPILAEIQQLTESFEPADSAELLGRVGEYDIQSLIGVGGMGAVFRGIDRELNRPVAIKFLLPRHASSELSRQRFTREAKAIAALDDDNVISVYRINPSPNYPYFSMPLIAGVSLQQHVYEEGPLPALELAQISKQIAKGLSAAHGQGLIHRDIKPANILLEAESNRVIVTDFGLAREESDAELTQTGMILGTPHYMSPEQADGRTVDQRSDLFSLGSVIHFMATGRPPFDGANQLELLKNIREAAAPSARQDNAAITVSLERAIQKLLARNPEHRFQTADEVSDYFDHYLKYLKSPVKNREPKISQVKRPTNFAFCSVAIAATLFIALGIGSFNSWISQQTQSPTTILAITPCKSSPLVKASETGDPETETENDGKKQP